MKPTVPLALSIIVNVSLAFGSTNFISKVHSKKQTSVLGWSGYGGNSQHTGTYLSGSQPIQTGHWHVSLDGNRSYYGSEVLAHFASPCITPANTVVYSYRSDAIVNGVSSHDSWHVQARSGQTGALMWHASVDYSSTEVFPPAWTAVYPLGLTGGNQIVVAGSAGSVLFANADTAGTTGFNRSVFYTNLATYHANHASFQGIKICTPITGTPAGDAYFGYLVEGNTPSLVPALGTGGVVHILPNHHAVFMSVSALGVDPALARPAINAAPALSNDGSSVYFSLCSSDTWTAYLVKLDASTLALQNSAKLVDPYNGSNSGTINESSASPMVGPDGHVFYGVFANYYRESHGWMLQFDGNLSPVDANGKKWPTGAFGWDDTASVVPTSCVTGYTGTAPYLILTKYNNYRLGTGDGVNRLAVLDPTSDSTSIDRQQGIPVMNEVITVAGRTPDASLRSAQYPNAVNEWCVNSVAVDVASKSAIVNSEDGHMYRWDFSTNKLIQPHLLAPATGEAYTCTAIGPDGTLYATNNCVLDAVGAYPSTKR